MSGDMRAVKKISPDCMQDTGRSPGPAGYKNTEAGLIPEDWSVKRLTDIAEFRNGKPYEGKIRRNGKYMLITLDSIDINGCLKKQHREIDYWDDSLKQGDIVTVLSDLAHGYLLGLSDVIPSNNMYVLNQRMGRIRLTEQASPEFVRLQINRHQSHFRVRGQGTSQKHIYKRDFDSLPIPYPEASEQRAIATALSDVDALLEELDRLIAKKRDLKQATMQQLLTGQTRLPGFEGEWELKALGHAGRCIRGVSYSGDKDLSPHETLTSIRLLRSNNVQSASINTNDFQNVNPERVSDQQIMRKDDILVCMANGSKALVGKAGAFNIDDGATYTFGAFMGVFRTERAIADPRFVYLLFQTWRYRDYIDLLLSGSSINNLRPSSIESMHFIFPPYNEQKAIAEIITEISIEIEVLVKRREKVALIKQAMMQELLTGRTRLI